MHALATRPVKHQNRCSIKWNAARRADTMASFMKRIVLTGGPCSGKTVISSAIVAGEPHRYVRVPEAATQVYEALRTRWDRLDGAGRRDVQRRIYHLQIEQEERLSAEYPNHVLLLDRGTVDGAAYWPQGPDDYWRDLGTSLKAQIARYDNVILLQSAAAIGLYEGDTSNPCRFEDAAAAVRNDGLLTQLWQSHPAITPINAYQSLADKIRAVKNALDALARQRQ
jgi:predicted ATPase